MSYDVSIWCVRPFADPSRLPAAEGWRTQGDGWSCGGRGWVLNSGPSEAVQPEDIPREVMGALPGIAHVVGASLEPLGAPGAGLTMLRRLTRAVAAEAHGVVLDPQAGSLEKPPGVKRFTPIKRDRGERFKVLQLSWWFDHARLLEEASLSAFLDMLETHLPEAMPRRYGPHEPPQFTLAETGRQHLTGFLLDHLARSVVWYASRPAAHFTFSVSRGCGWQPLGPGLAYRCNHAALALDAAALAQPGWPAGLRRFWRRASEMLRPFFGDVRTLGGYTGRLPNPCADAQTEQHPVGSWWWRGIPPELGHAAVVGAPYLAQWPQLRDAGEVRDGLAFLSCADWAGGGDAAALVGGVPEELALPFMPRPAPHALGGVGMRYPSTYPRNFPLGVVPPGVPRAPRAPGWRFWRRRG